jgi:putative ABC transport system permease protein
MKHPLNGTFPLRCAAAAILKVLINKLIFANLGHRPLRTFLSILAIGVEVTMILTLVGVSYGTLDASARRARGLGADIFVRPPGTSAMSLSSAPMSDKMTAALAARPGVAMATGTMVQSVGGFDTMQGVDFNAITKMSGGFHFLAGGPFQPDADQIVVDENYAHQKKLHVGDHVKLANHDWEIAGIEDSGTLARVLAPIAVLQRITGNEGKISAVYIKLDNPKQAEAFATQLKAALPGYSIYTVDEFTSQLTVSATPMLSDFIGVVIGIATIVGFIVVFMAMYTAVLERTREIGIIKAVGAGPGYILNILFRETILLALFGTVLGILMTYGTQWLMAHAVPASLVEETVYKWWPICAVIAIAGALLGTIIPAMKAVNQDATEALSYE